MAVFQNPVVLDWSAPNQFAVFHTTAPPPLPTVISFTRISPLTSRSAHAVSFHIAIFPAPVKYILVPASVDDQYCGLVTVPHIGRPYVPSVRIEYPVIALPDGHVPPLLVHHTREFPSMIFWK